MGPERKGERTGWSGRKNDLRSKQKGEFILVPDADGDTWELDWLCLW